MKGFTDIHSHFLYGMDDGARSKTEMEAMLDAAHKDGISSLFATSHMIPGVRPLDDNLVKHRVKEAIGYCRFKGYRMNIYEGAEILYTPVMRNYLLNHPLKTLGNSEYVLIEFVPDIDFEEMKAALERLQRYGYIAVLAHAERYKCLFYRNRVEKLKDQFDMRFQVNAQTVLSEHGFFRSRCIHGWLEKKQIDFVASDAHGLKSRSFQMSEAYKVLLEKFGRTYADQLVGIYHNE